MKRLMNPILALVTATMLAAGCGGGGGSSNPDRDGDGIPNTSDSFPDDGTRFASYATILLDRLTGGLFGTAVAINNSDHVVGLSEDGAGTIKAVQWTVTGTAAGAPTQLNPLAGNDYSAAYAIDDTGIAVGESAKGGDFVAVQWPVGSLDPTELSLTGFGAPAAAYGISGSRIVGEASSAGSSVAVLWSTAAGDPVPLGTLGGTSSAAYAIEETLIAGESTNADGATRGAVWVLNAGGAPGAPIALAPLEGHVASIALGINTGGEIVGESESAAGVIHAVLWTLDAAGVPGTPVDLGPGGAAAVNGSNRIAGHSGTPGAASVWDTRNTSLADAILTGSSGLSQAYGLNDGDLVVGLAGNQGVVAVPQ